MTAAGVAGSETCQANISGRHVTASVATRPRAGSEHELNEPAFTARAFLPDNGARALAGRIGAHEIQRLSEVAGLSPAASRSWSVGLTPLNDGATTQLPYRLRKPARMRA